MNKTALITGASKGLGLALAHLLEEKGYRVIGLGYNHLRYELSADRQALIELIRRETPSLVINNAGFGLYGDAVDLSVADQLNMIEVNCRAAVEITLEAARALKEATLPGTIVNIASAAAFLVYPSFATYAASKTFLLAWSQSVDAELKPCGIRVLTSCPGQINTGFRERASHGKSLRHDFWTLSVEKVAARIYRQIEKGKSVDIVNGWYRWGIALAKCLPKSVVQRVLRSAIQKRLS